MRKCCNHPFLLENSIVTSFLIDAVAAVLFFFITSSIVILPHPVPPVLLTLFLKQDIG